jgi:hypothetical protein
VLRLKKSDASKIVGAFQCSAIAVPNYVRSRSVVPRLHETYYLVLLDDIPVIAASVYIIENIAGVEFHELAIVPANIQGDAISLLVAELAKNGVKDITCAVKAGSRLLRTAELLGFELVGCNFAVQGARAQLMYFPVPD